jgi:hypothetical protein
VPEVKGDATSVFGRGCHANARAGTARRNGLSVAWARWNAEEDAVLEALVFTGYWVSVCVCIIVTAWLAEREYDLSHRMDRRWRLLE